MSDSMIEVTSELTASVWQVRCAVGDELSAGDEIVVLEAMKMEIPVLAPEAGQVQEILVQPGDLVDEGASVARLSPLP
ncbi:biotin/lipoyl-binding carrier protein [Streptomyces sp. NPDC000987]|uniref:biotin/lipoyl-binding carrier protein n=1 Tax=unclassified Streptomyces TaxID=2593676 RepID=UPI0033327011